MKHSNFCSETDPARGYIISTIFFVSGIVTLLQSIIGVRLPIVQGGTFTLVTPTLAILALDKWSHKCPSSEAEWSEVMEDEELQRELWQVKISIMNEDSLEVDKCLGEDA